MRLSYKFKSRCFNYSEHYDINLTPYLFTSFFPTFNERLSSYCFISLKDEWRYSHPKSLILLLKKFNLREVNLLKEENPLTRFCISSFWNELLAKFKSRQVKLIWERIYLDRSEYEIELLLWLISSCKSVSEEW